MLIRHAWECSARVTVVICARGIEAAVASEDRHYRAWEAAERRGNPLVGEYEVNRSLRTTVFTPKSYPIHARSVAVFPNADEDRLGGGGWSCQRLSGGRVWWGWRGEMYFKNGGPARGKEATCESYSKADLPLPHVDGGIGEHVVQCDIVAVATVATSDKTIGVGGAVHMAVRDQAARVVCDDGHPRVVHVAVVRAEHLAPACASLGSEDIPDAVTTADIDGDVHRRGRDPLATVLPEGRRHHDAAVVRVGGQFDEAGTQ